MKTTEKIDLCKIHKDEYAAPKKPVFLDIKAAIYLVIEGQGEPGGEAFTDKIGALYGMAFTIKMTRKFAGLGDYAVSKLEGLWWGTAGNCFASLPKEQWCWKLMIRTPDFITENDLADARKKLLEKGKTKSVEEVKLERIDEGRCVQMLHVGPYEREGETVAQMQTHARSKGMEFGGRHHEIYLSDPRRVAPEKLKTILRCPVR